MIDAMNKVTQLRFKLLENGYSPLCNRDKRIFLPEWPKIEITPGLLRKWGRSTRDKATSVRIENGLAVIDCDIDDNDASQMVLQAMEDAFPALLNCPLRHSGGAKFALFLRCDELFGRIHTRRWIAPGDDAEDGTHVVEMFGGAHARQFGCFGPHTVTDAGEVVKSYGWDEQSLLDVPLASLPEFTKADMFKMSEIAEQVLKAEGFEVMSLSTSGENVATRIYDLTDDMRFNCMDGYQRSLTELAQIAGAQDSMRCSAEFIEGYRGKASLTRCLVGATHNGHMTIWDSATGDTHMQTIHAPKDRTAGIKKLTGKLSTADNIHTTVSKLMGKYGFCAELQPNVVVPLEPGATPITMATFRVMMQPYSKVELGPKGGEKRINPVDVWSIAEERVELGGQRMRPDMERPLFVERGVRYVNTYEPPKHKFGGSADMGIALIDHLLPNARERNWFTQWLAYKYLHPHVPGPAVVMVAREHGTGRGTLGELIKKLFGPRYVGNVPFDIFAGRNSQSQYTDWSANLLVALINESSTSSGSSIYRAKQDNYEHLKELVEPRPIERLFVRKGLASFTSTSHASYFIATNNPDALPLPEGDRRFAVLTNGGTGSPDFWREVNEWMDEPSNIGAFAQWLETYTLDGYGPYNPPLTTEAKLTMSELSTSDLDKALDAVITNMKGEVIVSAQVITGMREAKQLQGLDFPDRWESHARKAVQRKLHRVGVKKGQNWHPMINGRRHSVYTVRHDRVDYWSKIDSVILRREISRNGIVPDNRALTGLPTRSHKKKGDCDPSNDD